MSDFLISRFHDSPVMISPSYQASFEANLNFLAASEHFQDMMTLRASSDDVFWNPEEKWLLRYRPYNVVNGILIIPVQGVLLSSFPYTLPWATGYEYIWQAYKRGQADDNVKAIALKINSGGGEVSEAFDVAERMFNSRGNKPVRAFATDFAFSAAYLMASPADTVVVTRTGGVGSIGVVTSHVDLSERLKNDGVKVTFIHYGKFKVDGNYTEPLSEETRKRFQAQIDDLGREFVDTVARNRNINAEEVRATEAGTFSAKDGIKIGLADSMAPFEEGMSAFLEEITINKEARMSTEKDKTYTKADVDAARAEGRAEGHSAGMTEARDRINTIMSSEEGKARPSAALGAIETSMSADEAVKFLAKLPVEKTEASADAAGSNTNAGASSNAADFSKAMQQQGTEQVGADSAQSEKPQSRAARALALSGLAKTKE